MESAVLLYCTSYQRHIYYILNEDGLTWTSSVVAWRRSANEPARRKKYTLRRIVLHHEELFWKKAFSEKFQPCSFLNCLNLFSAVKTHMPLATLLCSDDNTLAEIVLHQAMCYMVLHLTWSNHSIAKRTFPRCLRRVESFNIKRKTSPPRSLNRREKISTVEKPFTPWKKVYTS